MNSKISKAWLTLERIDHLVALEPYLIVVVLGLLAYGIYRIFLTEAPAHRHRNLRRRFFSFFVHAAVLGLGLALYQLGSDFINDLSTESQLSVARLLPYLGLFIVGAVIHLFIKIFSIYVFEILFLKHMKEGVPLLLVNISSLLLAVVLYGWAITEILNIKVLPVLATSAVFTAVIGLALQDTLGNLFAGVALQFDKPFEIGDWIEVSFGGQKWIGQVEEVSWRATVLLSFTDELISIPNKIISQAQVSNYSVRKLPIIRSQLFRVPLEGGIDEIKQTILLACQSVPGLRKDPSPVLLLIENSDSWIIAKLIYYVDNYGEQYVIGDRVLEACHKALQSRNLSLARQQHRVFHTSI
jgi:small-conductance mechanosensitive channel